MPKPGSTTARGYGAEHQAIRKSWSKVIAAGRGVCHAKQCLEPTRTIAPGQAWDLGHNEDRTAWTGPEHRRCNRADGGRRRHETKTSTRKTWDF